MSAPQSKRRFRILNAGVDRPDERYVPEADRIGTAVVVRVQSRHLKSEPVDEVRLTDWEALLLAEALLTAVRNRGEIPR